MSEQPADGPDDAPAAPPDDTGDAGDTGDASGTADFRLAYVTGATPGRWARTWRDRLPDVRLELEQVEAADAVAALTGGRADAAILRLPVDKDVLHAIPLYAELPVVVVSRDHLLAATTEEEVVTAADLEDDVVWLSADDVLYPGRDDVPGRAPEAYDDGAGGPVEPERPATAADAIALVATGVGVTIVPMSLARLHHRKDVTYRVLDGGPEAPVGLAWPVDGGSELVEEMVGIVRGRTANSSRGRGAPDEGGGREERRARRREAQREAKASEGGGRGTDGSGRAGRAAGRSGGRPSGRPGRPGRPGSSGKPGRRGGR